MQETQPKFKYGDLVVGLGGRRETLKVVSDPYLDYKDRYVYVCKRFDCDHGYVVLEENLAQPEECNASNASEV